MKTKAGDAYIIYRFTKRSEFDIYATFVPKNFKGLGLGETLVTAATNYALSHGYHPIASCPFAHKALRLANWGIISSKKLENEL